MVHRLGSVDNSMGTLLSISISSSENLMGTSFKIKFNFVNFSG